MKTNIIITTLLLFISMNIYAQDDKLYIYYYPNFEDVDATLGYVDSSGYSRREIPLYIYCRI